MHRKCTAIGSYKFPFIPGFSQEFRENRAISSQMREGYRAFLPQAGPKKTEDGRHSSCGPTAMQANGLAAGRADAGPVRAAALGKNWKLAR
jgi:hypothetical protein